MIKLGPSSNSQADNHPAKNFLANQTSGLHQPLNQPECLNRYFSHALADMTTLVELIPTLPLTIGVDGVL